MRARAFVPRTDRRTWQALGWLIGMLLVRSLARGQRVADAMRCRGFDGQLRLLQPFHWQRQDTLALLVAVSLTAALTLVDHRGAIL
jgi:cobalt/nickel transport system permease protein